MASMKTDFTFRYDVPGLLDTGGTNLAVQPAYQYTPTGIQPCTYAINIQGQPYHLLYCGHVVAIDVNADDSRCGVNCLHTADWLKRMNANPIGNKIKIAKFLDTEAQAPDSIYCETCQGIPVCHWYILNPEAKANTRGAVSLTRLVIQRFTDSPPYRVHELLCRPFFVVHGVPYDVNHAHILRCGHEVHVEPARPCGANCTDTASCRRGKLPSSKREGDAIICRECVGRAEKIYDRYARTGGGFVIERYKQGRARYTASCEQMVASMEECLKAGFEPPYYCIQDGVYPDQE